MHLSFKGVCPFRFRRAKASHRRSKKQISKREWIEKKKEQQRNKVRLCVECISSASTLGSERTSLCVQDSSSLACACRASKCDLTLSTLEERGSLGFSLSELSVGEPSFCLRTQQGSSRRVRFRRRSMVAINNPSLSQTDLAFQLRFSWLEAPP